MAFLAKCNPSFTAASSIFYNFFQYGGDVTRKLKLLKQQAEGKKKLRKIGNVEVPREAFLNVLKK